jgi:valyl-tRNA synthetase
LGWPEETEDLHYFYPTSLLSTGFDIIFFWVARMIMMGLHFPGDVPFREVYIHALIRDAEGRKMSKSAGNVIDPLDTIRKFGTDALRFTLASLAVPGRDVFLSEDRIEGYRNFCNKIWNASRFVLMNLEGYDSDAVSEQAPLTLADQWIMSRYTRLVENVDRHLSVYNFSEASRALYNFFWGEYCDWYIEMCKPRLYAEEESQRRTAQHILASVLEMSLRLLHPFMPFITEEIWQKLPREGESITVSAWPLYKSEWLNLDSENMMGILQDAIYGIRHLRSEYHVPPGKRVRAVIRVPSTEDVAMLQAHRSYIYQLAGVEELSIGPDEAKPESSAAEISGHLEVFLPLAGLVDFESEKRRLSLELAKLEQELSRLDRSLSDKAFLSKAPESVVAKKQQAKEELRIRKNKLEEQIQTLG